MTKKLNISPAVTVDTAIFTIDDGRLKVLFTKRAKAPFTGKWALPGGFLFHGESTANAAKRVLKEKSGLGEVYLEQLYTFDDIGRDPRGPILSVAYFALINAVKIKLDPKAGAEVSGFFDIKKIPSLAFDHAKILAYALQRLRYKLEYTNAVSALLPHKFTLGQLQSAYEIILDRKIDKRNFRKKFLALNLIKPTREKLAGIRHRPAQLYSFGGGKPVELKRFF